MKLRFLFLFLLFAFVFLSGCKPDAGRSGGDSRPGAAAHVVRILAISPYLPGEARRAAETQLAHEADLLCADSTPAGTAVLVMDADACQPIGTLKAIDGAARFRKQALAHSLTAVCKYLDRPRPGQELDGRLRLPQLAHAVAQRHLPSSTSVVVLGNPLFLGGEHDRAFSMQLYFPTDGFLFKPPQFCVFSTVGREHDLAGQYWYLGFPNDSFWVNDSHETGVLHFWAVYLRSQSATLAAFQPSLEAAFTAAREGLRAPVSKDEPDPNAPAIMVRCEHHLAAEERQSDAPVVVADSGVHPQETGVLDAHGNPAGAQHDLVADGALAGHHILLLTFDHDPDTERWPLPAALKAKGCDVERVRYPLPQLPAWKSMLAAADQVWLISSAEQDHFPAAHMQSLIDRWKTDRLALYLAGDNAPFIQEANQVLSRIAPGVELFGNTPGDKELNAASGDGPGFQAGSPLFHGVNVLFEGSTVSEIRGRGFTPVCRSSDGGILLATLDLPGAGRVVIDGGYTRWFERFWKTAGASRLATNIAGYLAGTHASHLVAK